MVSCLMINNKPVSQNTGIYAFWGSLWIVAFWGLHWGPLIQGNYNTETSVCVACQLARELDRFRV